MDELAAYERRLRRAGLPLTGVIALFIAVGSGFVGSRLPRATFALRARHLEACAAAPDS